MWLMIAGPYSHPDPAERARRLEQLNLAAVGAKERGYTPIIGVNAALPVLAAAGLPDSHPWMMELSMALAERCDACLLLAPSPGASREAQSFRARGLPVYHTLDELPARTGPPAGLRPK